MAPSLAAALKAATLNDHEAILDAANASLKTSKNDTFANHTRIVALLKLDRFDDVLRTVSGLGENIKSQFSLETAYAMYKLGQLDDAAQVLSTCTPKTEAVQQLEGQIAYRAERFEDAWKMYNSLEDGNYSDDLYINKTAVLAQLGWQGKGSDCCIANPKTITAFEVAYNLACLQISKGNLMSALHLLQVSKKLCDELDDLSDEEKQSELVPILMQQVYVYSRLGFIERAKELQELLVLSDDCGEDTKSLARVNSAILSSIEASNRFLAQRNIEGPISIANGQKLFNYQLSSLRQLQLVLDLSIQKYKGTDSIAKAKSKSGPATSAAVNGFAPIGVAALSWMSPEKPLAIATDLLEKRPCDVGLALTVIQLCVKEGLTDVAISHMEKTLKKLDAMKEIGALQVRYSPGLIAVVVSLYKLAGRNCMARAELRKASCFWQKYPETTSKSLLVEAGLELLKSDKMEDHMLASETFSLLLASDAKNNMAISGLVAAVAGTDQKKAEALAVEIPSVKALTNDSNVSALLEAGVASNTKINSGIKRGLAISSASSAPVMKKRRQRKLPANFEEGKIADPERWLPMRDRTSSRPKGGKKGKKKAEALTQGGYVKGEETLELVGGVGAVKVEKAPQVSTAAKKKKKGRK
ncbi:Signal recognition particle subunit srp72 [Ceratocystis fimbriata CBS 114723]|uniref:Signal recognition particle subunit SRP72 n=1 Tax=Ceratocystis fimbriata CBS 114723 TaxID=1035309 RepID=A0A2C5X030_9PEZI|nr:Signal recognition particle subunit srp72 [Ceratocystis fimbriata CBS 114723]